MMSSAASIRRTRIARRYCSGFLTPGQRGDTGVFTTARTCEYHDHTALGVPAFQGRIIIR